MNPWPHQLRGVEEVVNATIRGVRRIILTSPTGMGKTWMATELAKIWLDRMGKVILYSNRKMMVDQISEGLTASGLYHGIRAAGYEDEREHAFQVSSIQTEHSRVTKKKTWDLHEADLVLVDEGHLQKGNAAKQLLRAHWEQGAAIVYLTATPLDMGDMADELIVAGTPNEGRKCGALVTASHFGADEPDLKAFKELAKVPPGEDPSATQQKLAMMTPGIFGRVWEWYQKLNPTKKPCLLFGPGVEESLWFAEKFYAAGVPAAHIDGNDCWINGTWFKSDREQRNVVKELHKAGKLKVICNRYVLREGVDWPWIEHVILAFIAGSLQTYLQTVGRGLRSSPGKTELIIQDHGGAWWRHGSVNEDREWFLEQTAEMAFALRAQRLRDKKTGEPFRCPHCGRVWRKGEVCLPAHGGCGFVLENRKRSRPVVSTDGTLWDMQGDIFRPRRTYNGQDGPKRWEQMYWRSRTDKGQRNFNSAMALFAMENNWGWPDRSWPFMPKSIYDFFQLVSEVSMGDLIPKEGAAAISKCRTCHAEIIWVRTEKGKSMPINALPAENGNLLVEDGLAKYLTPEDIATYKLGAEMPPLFLSHFATCVDAPLYRKA